PDSGRDRLFVKGEINLKAMIKRLLSLLPSRDITDPDGTVYLRRYILLHRFGYKVMLHNILIPDYSRAHHDHPWSFITVVLKGGYIEDTRDGEKHRKPWRAYKHDATFRHSIRGLPNGPAW